MSHGGKRPYQEEKVDENSFLREFSVLSSDKDLEWHRDAESREIEVVSGTGWQFQYDNCLPVDIKPSRTGLWPSNFWGQAHQNSLYVTAGL